MKKNTIVFFLSFFLMPAVFTQSELLSDNKPVADEIDFVMIGNQVWMASNLDVSHFSNGIPIQEAMSYEDWHRLGLAGEPAWSYYEGDAENGRFFGKLYNGYAVSSANNICPMGFRLPTKADWEQLIEFLGGAHDIGLKIKSMDGWAESGNGQNETGFNALPAGHRNGGGAYSDLGEYAYWWSNTQLVEGYAYGVNLTYENNTMFRGQLGKAEGYSVRCIR